MTLAVDYKSYVEPIRAELLKLIRAGRVTYYGELGQTIGKPARPAAGYCAKIATVEDAHNAIRQAIAALRAAKTAASTGRR